MKKNDTPVIKFAHLQKLNHIKNNQTTTVELNFLVEDTKKIPKLWVRPLSPVLNNELTEFLLANPEIEKAYVENITLQAELAKSKSKSIKHQLKAHKTNMDIANIFMEHIAKYVVVNWENIFNDAGEEIPFSIETFTKLYETLGSDLYKGILIKNIWGTADNEFAFIEQHADLRELDAVDKAGKKS